MRERVRGRTRRGHADARVRGHDGSPLPALGRAWAGAPRGDNAEASQRSNADTPTAHAHASGARLAGPWSGMERGVQNDALRSWMDLTGRLAGGEYTRESGRNFFVRVR